MDIAAAETATKSCGSCTKCCEGWLSGDIRGHKMYLGKPCFFVEIGKGCTDYENRPESPCKTFQCLWLEEPEVPEEFKPEISGCIISYAKTNNGILYLSITKAPNNPSVELLSWCFKYVFSRGINLFWEIDNYFHWIGGFDFCEEMERSKRK